MKSMYPFYLHKRKVVDGSYWYVYYIDPTTGKQRTAISINTLRKKLGLMDRTQITREKDVRLIAQKALDEGLVTFGAKDPLFIDYVDNFWDFENSDYIRRRNKKNPDSIGHDYAKSMKGVFKNHAVPHLPAKLKLSMVKIDHIEKIVNALIDDGILSNASIKLGYRRDSVVRPFHLNIRPPVRTANPVKTGAPGPVQEPLVVARQYWDYPP
ncbi:MAG: hypothetical protein PHU24_06415 [Sphaerochaetaceae bacterium]|nr:hypothetical protein [Sphaerochaetaceae bacterium]